MTKTILLVEDEEIQNENLRETFERKGYTVFAYTKGKECLHDVETNSLKYDLAIIDLSLPDIGGDELINRLKGIYPKIPIFSSSGYDDKPRKADRHYHKSMSFEKFIKESDFFLSDEFDFGDAF